MQLAGKRAIGNKTHKDYVEILAGKRVSKDTKLDLSRYYVPLATF